MSNIVHFCIICNKNFTSKTNLFIHKREKHTFYNTIKICCKSCNTEFNSPFFNKKRHYSRCEECRHLQKILNTSPLTHNTYIYGNNKERYYIKNGNEIRVCSIYDCLNIYPCRIHHTLDIIQCINKKCKNCYIKNNFNQCQKCITQNYQSKNKIRNKIKEFKIELGGKCVKCGFNDLFNLEFDHINPIKKQIQVTRSIPINWYKERDNIQLLCGRCHRIKSSNNHSIYTNTPNSKCKEDKKKFVREIKKRVGCCQNCKWTIDDKDNMCAALDFDHLSDKVKQISNLYLCKKERIVQEITKTRLLCRHCHEIWTCIQRNGTKMQFYYNSNEIHAIKNKLGNKDTQLKCNLEILNILNELCGNKWKY